MKLFYYKTMMLYSIVYYNNVYCFLVTVMDTSRNVAIGYHSVTQGKMCKLFIILLCIMIAAY